MGCDVEEKVRKERGFLMRNYLCFVVNFSFCYFLKRRERKGRERKGERKTRF